MANPLGQNSPVPQERNPQLLYSLQRQKARVNLPCPASDFIGWDSWNLYEVSFLTGPQQLPTNMWLRLEISAHTEKIVESKSAKLYLWSLNEERFANEQEFSLMVRSDLHQVLGWRFTGGPETIPDSSLAIIREKQGLIRQAVPDHALLGGQNQSTNSAQKAPAAPKTPQLRFTNHVGRGVYADPTFRSLCPVTGQPDWATVVIAFVGAEPEPASLRQFLASFRNHQGFHEQCAEEIFCRLWQTGQLNELWVSLHFLRRGGIDITPVRHSPGFPIAEFILAHPWMTGPFYRQ